MGAAIRPQQGHWGGSGPPVRGKVDRDGCGVLQGHWTGRRRQTMPWGKQARNQKRDWWFRRDEASGENAGSVLLGASEAFSGGDNFQQETKGRPVRRP